MLKNVTCKKCGWVHFVVTREYAEDEVARFNEYFNSLSLEKRKEFYGNKPSHIKHYEYCNFCGGSYKDFRDSKEDDCPIGCTIGPIIKKED